MEEEFTIQLENDVYNAEEKLQEKTITPTIEGQTILPDIGYNGLSKAIVNGVTNEIDENIKPENIRKDINVLGVTGTMEERKTEEHLTVTPSIKEQIIEPKDNHVYNQVTISGVDNTIDSNIIPENIKKGSTILGVAGNSEELNAEPSKSITPSTTLQTITPSEDYNSMSQVDIEAVTSDIDRNILANNIKAGVSILGVEGTYDNRLPEQSKNITPLTTSQTVKPDTGYTLSEVDISAVDSTIDSNIVGDNIKKGTSILGVNGTYEGIIPTGTLEITENGIHDVTNYANVNANVVTKYTPRFINFRGFDGTELDYEMKNLDTSNVTSMAGMFSSCSNLTSLDLNNLDTSNVTSMANMFSSCNNLTSLDIGNWDTSNVTSMASMFSICYKLTSLDIGNWDTSNVTSMAQMFYYCNNLTSLDIGNWDTSNVTSMAGMFSSCSKLTSLDIRKFNFNKVTNYSNMFNSVPNDCEIIVADDIAKEWITSKFTNLTNVKTVAELETSN